MNTMIAMFSLWPGKTVAHGSSADIYFLMLILIAVLAGLIAVRNEERQTIKSE